MTVTFGGQPMTLRVKELTCGHDFLYELGYAPMPRDVVWCCRCGGYRLVAGTYQERIRALRGISSVKDDAE